MGQPDVFFGGSGSQLARTDKDRPMPGLSVEPAAPAPTAIAWSPVGATRREDRVPAELFNRVLWDGVKGDQPYPVQRSATVVMPVAGERRWNSKVPECGAKPVIYSLGVLALHACIFTSISLRNIRCSACNTVSVRSVNFIEAPLKSSNPVTASWRDSLQRAPL